jgi:hypothetical protein
MWRFVWVLALAACTKETPVRVHVDNGNSVAAEIRVDGTTVVTVPPYDIREINLTSGKHHLVARAGGRVLDDVKLDDQNGSWVFNIDRQSHYMLLTAYYCPAQVIGAGGCPSPETAPMEDAALFEMPHVFMTNVTPTRQRMSVEKIVTHDPLHTDRPCCHAFLEAAN